MAYIDTVSTDQATGRLARIYRQAIDRAGKVFHIVSLQSLHPPVLEASIGLYRTLMLGPGPLDRRLREMLATVTARELHCFY